MKYTLREVETLRTKIISNRNYSKAFLESGPLSSSKDLYSYLINTHHLFNLIKDKFENLPLLLHGCPKTIDPMWHKSILEWRLEIGK